MKKIFERIVESPAVMLDNTVETTKQISETVITETITITETVTNQASVQKAKEYWKLLGPGLTTGAADDDPSGIATYSQAGAQYGFQLLWLSLFTFPLMATIQEMCARIGMVTGRGLAANIRLNYSKKILYICAGLLFIANVFNIGADLGAMAKATQLIFPSLNFGLLVLGFALFSLLLQIFTTYEKYARFLKYLALILLSYVITAFTVQLDWSAIFRNTLIPQLSWSKDQIILIFAILGTTISPYLFFWQTSQEVEEQILEGKTSIAQRQGTTQHDLNDMRVDIWSGMFLSNIVMFFIIAVCGATLFSNGITQITTAADAAEALRPLAGEGAYWLFALGIIGTGLLAIPVLAGSASYAIAESFNWNHGLYRHIRQAYSFYGIIIIAMLLGLGLNFLGIDPIKALIYSALANGLVAPIVLYLIISMSSSEKIMGEWKNSKLATSLGWLVTTIMVVAGIAALIALMP